MFSSVCLFITLSTRKIRSYSHWQSERGGGNAGAIAAPAATALTLTPPNYFWRYSGCSHASWIIHTSVLMVGSLLVRLRSLSLNSQPWTDVRRAAEGCGGLPSDVGAAAGGRVKCTRAAGRMCLSACLREKAS